MYHIFTNTAKNNKHLLEIVSEPKLLLFMQSRMEYTEIATGTSRTEAFERVSYIISKFLEEESDFSGFKDWVIKNEAV